MRFSICNEVFEQTPLEDVCREVADCGYDGLELAPFTLAQDIRQLEPDTRTGIRRRIEDAGLEIVGLHWLLVAPKGFHLTTDDRETYNRTVDYGVALISLCQDLGGKVLIHGSPAQREIHPDQDRTAVEERVLAAFRSWGEAAESAGVVYCIEPLDAKQTNFIQTPEEALDWVERTDRPGFQMMLDCRATFEAGLEPVEEYVRCRKAVRHIHVNDPNKLGPGMGDRDFSGLAQALMRNEYSGYVSVEPFDYSPGAGELARESLAYLKQIFSD